MRGPVGATGLIGKPQESPEVDTNMQDSCGEPHPAESVCSALLGFLRRGNGLDLDGFCGHTRDDVIRRNVLRCHAD